MRTVMTLAAVVVLLTGNVYSQRPTIFSQQSTERQPAIIALNMSGDLAREYARIAGPTENNETLDAHKISTTAFIAERLGNDQVRIEHSAQFKREGKPDRLVTLTGTVDTSTIRSLVRTVLEPNAISFSNNSTAPKETGVSPAVKATHLSVRFLSLTDLTGIRLRSWTLESEIAK
jgi:hypothetical protein